MIPGTTITVPTPKSRFIYMNNDSQGSLVLDIAYIAQNLLDIEYENSHTCERHKKPVPAMHVSTKVGARYTFEGTKEVIKVLEELVKEREDLGEALGWLIQEAKLKLEVG